MDLVRHTEQFGANRSRIWVLRISTQDGLGSTWTQAIRWESRGVFI